MEPSDLLTLLSKSESTSSGRGASYYKEDCARRARLDTEFGRSSSFQAQVGTAFHKLAELYYTGVLSSIALPLDDLANFETDFVQEALRVFAGYIQHFPADEWTVIAAERLLPRNDEDREKIRVAVGLEGLPPEDYFSQRSDVAVSINEEQAAAFLIRRFLAVETGNWLVDYKTHAQKDAKAGLKYSMEQQFLSNMMGHHAVFPEEQIKGLIVVEPIRHKKLTRESFRTFIVPFPSEVQQESIRKYYRYKAAYLKTDQPNLSACDDWGCCSHYMLGRCNRV
jgi:hypothetical protein